jgi:hypothetical protein
VYYTHTGYPCTCAQRLVGVMIARHQASLFHRAVSWTTSDHQPGYHCTPWNNTQGRQKRAYSWGGTYIQLRPYSPGKV